MAAPSAKIQRDEKLAGLLLIAAALLALVAANSAFASTYHHFLDTKLGPPMPRLALAGWAVLRFIAPPAFSERDRDEAFEIFGEDQEEFWERRPRKR